MNILCRFWGHTYRVIREVSPKIRELRCQRCRREFGMNDELKALLPLDDDLRQEHDILLQAIDVK